VALGTSFALLIPLLAMQFTEAVAWSASDFIVAGSLLLGFGLTFVVLTGIVRSRRAQVVIGIVLAAMLLTTWAELAVGVFGSPIAGS
jgi:hypothetical protein